MKTYFSKDSSYGDATDLLIIDTTEWTDADWDEVDNDRSTDIYGNAREVIARKRFRGEGVTPSETDTAFAKGYLQALIDTEGTSIDPDVWVTAPSNEWDIHILRDDAGKLLLLAYPYDAKTDTTSTLYGHIMWKES